MSGGRLHKGAGPDGKRAVEGCGNGIGEGIAAEAVGGGGREEAAAEVSGCGEEATAEVSCCGAADGIAVQEGGAAGHGYGASAAYARTYGALENRHDLRGIISEPATFVSGYAIGIIAVNLVYPKLPGNVANASTYPFPVLYKIVSFEIEELFEGSDSIRQTVIEAARELERCGVRAIVGACGFFAHFQKDVVAAVDIPVFISSLCQLPMIKTALSPAKSIAVVAASGESITDELLANVGTDSSRIVVQDIGQLPEFHAIRYGGTVLDNGALTDALCRVLTDLINNKDNNIGAILLECSDLPPYAKAVQAATGLPVFDFNSMINLVYHAVVQRTYYGWL